MRFFKHFFALTLTLVGSSIFAAEPPQQYVNVLTWWGFLNFALTNAFKLKSNYTSFMLESLYLRDHLGKSVGTPHGFNAMAEIIREV